MSRFYTKRLVVMLSEAQDKELRKLADHLGYTKTDLARDAIQSMIGVVYAEREKMVDQAVDERVAGRDN